MLLNRIFTKARLLKIPLVALSLFLAAAYAGIIGAPYSHGGLALAHSAPIIVAHEPVVAHEVIAHPIIAHAPLATSYSNSYRVVHNSIPIVKTVAEPIAVHHSPVIALTHGAIYHH